MCVCGPPPSIGRCQVTGGPCHWLSAGFLLEQSHCSQHYHKLMRNAQARLSTHTLIRSSDVTRDTQTMSTPEHMNLKRFFFLPSFGLIFTLKYHFPSQGVESIQNVRIVLLYKTSTHSEVLNIYFLLSRHCLFIFC